MYATVRRYKNAGALGDAMASRSGEVKDLLTSVPGFGVQENVKSVALSPEASDGAVFLNFSK